MSNHEIYLREYLSILFEKAAEAVEMLEAEIRTQQDGCETFEQLECLKQRCENRARDFRQTKVEVRRDEADRTGD